MSLGKTILGLRGNEPDYSTPGLPRHRPDFRRAGIYSQIHDSIPLCNDLSGRVVYNSPFRDSRCYAIKSLFELLQLATVE
jgi:hypothetical protein